MSQLRNTGTSSGYSLSTLIGVIADVQTYKNLLYLILAFPLGLFYYIAVTVGFTLGIGLTVLLIGFVILVGTVLGVRFIASFERRLANTLLGTDIAKPADVEQTTDGLAETAKAYLTATSTWQGLGFVILKFPIGILSFVLLVAFLGTAIELLLLPLVPEGALNIQIAGWRIAQSFETPTLQLIAVPVGVVFGILSLHILNAFARANVLIASSLLGSSSDTGE
jgi:hypothetical protein